MKTVPKLIASAFIISLVLLSTMVSCKKETVTNTVTNTDTVYVNNFDPITLSFITANSWMIEEGRGVRGSNIFYYLRSGTPANNSEDLDDEFIRFNSDGTALYHAQSGFERTITWEFDNTNNTMLTLHYTNTPADFDVYWDNMRAQNGKLYFDEYYTDGNLGWDSHCQMIREPKP